MDVDVACKVQGTVKITQRQYRLLDLEDRYTFTEKTKKS